MNFILAFNTEDKLKTRQLPSIVVQRTRTFPKRKKAVQRTDERAAIFVLNARSIVQNLTHAQLLFSSVHSGQAELKNVCACVRLNSFWRVFDRLINESLPP